MQRWSKFLVIIIFMAVLVASAPLFVNSIKGKDYRCIANSIISLLNERRQGWSCLHHAAVSGDKEWVIELLDDGADLEARSSEWKTPIYEAAKQGETNIVKLLHERGADINSRNSRLGFTPVHVAAEYNHHDTLEYILSKGVDVNVKNAWLQTPLSQVSWKQQTDVEIFKVLVDAGAEINTRDNKGFSPLHKTAYAGKIEATHYLISKGADINIKTDDGQTPLMRAAKSGQYDIVKFLLESGAEIRKEQGKYSAYTLAEKGGYKNIVALLEKYSAIDTYRLSGLINQAYEYSQKGNYEQSLEVFNRAIDLDPKSHQAYYYRGRTYEKMGKLNLAIQDLKTCLELEVDEDDSRVTEALHAIAYMLTTQRKHSEAIEYYTKYIELEPDKLTAYRNRAGVYASVGMIDKARKDVRFACENGDNVSCQLYGRLGMKP